MASARILLGNVRRRLSVSDDQENDRIDAVAWIDSGNMRNGLRLALLAAQASSRSLPMRNVTPIGQMLYQRDDDNKQAPHSVEARFGLAAAAFDSVWEIVAAGAGNRIAATIESPGPGCDWHMRNLVYAILIALVAFSGGAWWGRQHNDQPSVVAAVPQQSSRAEVARERSPPLADRIASNVSRSSNSERDLALAAAAENAEAHPIDVFPGFESVLTPPSNVAADQDNPASIPVRRHLKLQAETRDESWADRVESDIRAQVRSELMAQGADPQRIELSVVECRTSGCEIQALGYPEDTGKGRDLQAILPKVMRTQMAADFDAKGLTMMVTGVPDGRMGFIAFLSRKSH